MVVVVVDETEVDVLCVVVDDTAVVEVVAEVVEEGFSGVAADSAKETSSKSALTTVATPTPVLPDDSLFLLPGTALVSCLQMSSSG